MDFFVTPVYKIREITDKEEVIVDVSASMCDTNGKINVVEVGFAILCLKSGDSISNIGIPIEKNNSEKFKEIVNNALWDLFVFMRNQRGYVNN